MESILALWLAGLAGGGHCLAMCGGVLTAFTLQLPPGPRWRYHLAFNVGRLGGYMLIGALAGWLGSLAGVLALGTIKTALWWLANLLLIAMGCYIAGWASWFTRIERVGVPVWRHIQPLLRRLLPVRHLGHALGAGLLWGWLPCGLVYTATLSALASMSAWHGALLMAAFGLGTLGNLLLIGAAAERLRAWMAVRWVRPLLGSALIAVGVVRLVMALGAA
ncbi:sulfite exporter TauE/SafE family protein [Chitinibacteraceae bacterium HSL-7]